MNWNISFALIIGAFLLGCSEKRISTVQSLEISDGTALSVNGPTIDKAELRYDRNKSLWILDSQLFTGFAVSYYSDGSIKERFGLLDGRKESQATYWYSNGQVKFSMSYRNGKLHGEKKTWSSDSAHTLLAHYNYNAGKLDGEQKKWYPTGELFMKMYFKEGKEHGLQHAYRKNGAMYANYEAREGRSFGLKRADLCYELSEENMVSR